jgi:MoaA/NifB/PqqE/SkfB family radical SAM enzyme
MVPRSWRNGRFFVSSNAWGLREFDEPVVATCGGEPLEYPDIPTLTREILACGKQLFLCTDGTLIRRRLDMIPPEMNFFWNVKVDGTESVHDIRAGLFAEALDGIKAAKNAGFFVVVTTTSIRIRTLVTWQRSMRGCR